MGEPVMSDLDARMRRLAARANRESVPQTNVSGRVLERLADGGESDYAGPLAFFALASVVVATGVVLMAVPTIYSALDPFEALARVTPILIQ